MSDNKDRYALARRILGQLGGTQFMVMTGSRPLLMDDRLRLRLKRNAGKANMLEIIGGGAPDRYEMHFFYYRAPNVKIDPKKGVINIEEKMVTKSKLTDVPAERLQDFFEAVTGLYVTLTPRPSKLRGVMVIE